MKTIYKYPIEPSDDIRLNMPDGAEIISLQMQFNVPCIWAIVDTDVKTSTTRVIEIYGTGHSMKDTPKKFIGTFQMMSGSLVFHAFERIVG